MRLLTCLLLQCALVSHVLAQGGGMMGGMGGMGSFDDSGSSRRYRFQGNWPSGQDTQAFQNDRALAYITVDGVAQIRVKPEKIRLVLAVTSQAEDAADCQQKIEQQIKKVRDAWTELGIAEDDVVEDFIAVLPRYEWHLTERDDEDVRIQERVGYRMQSNLHVSVADEGEAMRAVNSAFRNGVTDIVTFDYWSSKLDIEKQRVIKLAMDAARQKAATLLEAFEQKPSLINVQENSAVFFPRKLYRTFQNVLEEEVESYPRSWRDLPSYKAYRPRMTFFDGLKTESDVRPKEVDMHPDIAIVSTVRLYYESPATKQPVAAFKQNW